MTEPISPAQVRSMFSDHVVDKAEARRLVAATKGDSGAMQALIAEADPTLDAVNVTVSILKLDKAVDANSCNFVAVGPGGRPDVSHEIVAMVTSADAKAKPLVDEKALADHTRLGSWNDFPAYLTQLKQRLDVARTTDPKAHVTLDLRVHGNNGTGFKLVDETESETDGKSSLSIGMSVASAAWINARLTEAGFTPDDLTVVSEACNGARSYVLSRDGFNATELANLKTQAERLGAKEKADFLADHPGGTATVAAPKVFDVPAGTPMKQPFTWIGLQQTVNRNGVALPAFVSGATTWERRNGAEEGVPLTGASTPLVAFKQLTVAPAVTGEVVTGYLVDAETLKRTKHPLVAAASGHLATSPYRAGKK